MTNLNIKLSGISVSCVTLVIHSYQLTCFKSLLSCNLIMGVEEKSNLENTPKKCKKKIRYYTIREKENEK